MAIFVCSCNSGPKDYDGHLERLISAVPAQSLEYEDQWLLEYGDFTGDGEDEMLAFVYEETGRYEEIVDGQYYLYYSTRQSYSTLSDMAVRPESRSAGNAMKTVWCRYRCPEN